MYLILCNLYLTLQLFICLFLSLCFISIWSRLQVVGVEVTHSQYIWRHLSSDLSLFLIELLEFLALCLIRQSWVWLVQFRLVGAEPSLGAKIFTRSSQSSGWRLASPHHTGVGWSALINMRSCLLLVFLSVLPLLFSEGRSPNIFWSKLVVAD